MEGSVNFFRSLYKCRYVHNCDAYHPNLGAYCARERLEF